MQTLLEQFISRKESTLKEPSRQGVPKGEKIGPSVKRARAALLSLRNKTQEQIAAELNTKQSVVARWMAQPEFAEEVKAYAEEFLQRLKPRIIAAVKKAHSGKPSTGHDFPELADSAEYSGYVIKPLFEWATAQPDVRVAYVTVLMFGNRKMVTDFLNPMLKGEMARCMELLKGKKLTKSSRAKISNVLELTQIYLKIASKQEGG